MFASNTFDDILGALTALSQRVDILKSSWVFLILITFLEVRVLVCFCICFKFSFNFGFLLEPRFDVAIRICLMFKSVVTYGITIAATNSFDNFNLINSPVK